MTEDSGWVESMTLGEVEVIRIVEWHRPFAPATGLVPGAGAGVWRENAHWLAPDHWDPVSGRAVLALQTWVLRGAGLTVVVDTGAGNGRERPGMPPFHRCTGDFPALLARAGVRPRDVDVVVNTHLHVDHVGWNTVERDGEWVPMFPRARYLLPAADDAHFGPAGGYGQGRDPADRLVYEDSVAPLHRAGVVELWEGSHRIDARLTLESVPGHTPDRPCCGSSPGAPGRCSWAIWCTARCRSCGRTPTAVPAWIRYGRWPAAAVSWSGRPAPGSC